MKPILFATACFFFQFLSISQCETLQFQELGSESAYCRLYNFQTGNGIVYASASGGTPSYSYQWTNLQTGATAANTTWGGLNPGLYEILVTDQMGCVLVDTIEVDSINPLADFSVDMNLLSNSGPPFNMVIVSVVVHNTSTGAPPYPGPFAEDTIYWKLGNTASYVPTPDIDGYQLSQFYGPSVQEICLAIANKNGCVDTICKLIEINESAGIDEIMDQMEISAFPNPANTYQTLTLNVMKQLDVIISIVDISGKHIKEVFSGQLKVGKTQFENELRALPGGVYFYQISTHDGKITMFSIQKI